MTDKIDICVIYHSAFGHNKKVAEAIAKGIIDAGKCAQLISVADLDKADAEALWQSMDNAQALIFGCPTYMGSVSAEYKIFMDASSKRWMERTWQGKWAAGFTVSGGLSGDKLGVLQQLCIFAMQHGMNWAGLPLVSNGKTEKDMNRLSSFMGLMCQANDAPADVTPPEGDIKTAVWFGDHIASLLD